MAKQGLVPDDIAARYEVHEWRNGLVILKAAHLDEWRNILKVLRDFTLLKSDILKPGGSKGLIAHKLDSHFRSLGWVEKAFNTRIVVDKSRPKAPRRVTQFRPLQEIYCTLRGAADSPPY